MLCSGKKDIISCNNCMGVQLLYVLSRIQERLILLTWLLIIICGFLILMPYGPGHPDVEMSGEGLYKYIPL